MTPKKKLRKLPPTLSARVSQIEKRLRHSEIPGASEETLSIADRLKALEQRMHANRHEDEKIKQTVLGILESNAEEAGLKVEQADLMGELSTQMDDLQSELKGIRQKSIDNMHKVTEGLGGVTWGTQEGHVRWIGLLTTPHLENVIKGGFGGSRARRKIEAELKRRRIDREYREGARKVETSEEVAARYLRKWQKVCQLGIPQGLGSVAMQMSIETASSFDQALKMLRECQRLSPLKVSKESHPLRERIALAWNILWNN